MSASSRSSSAIGLILSALVLVGTVACQDAAETTFDTGRLPIFGPKDVNPDLVSSAASAVDEPHVVPAFSFVNQDGDAVTERSMDGRIYVASFIFTTCSSICMEMTRELVYLQDQLRGDAAVRLLSHTVDPEHDTVPVLHAFAEDHGVDSATWQLVTGDRGEIERMARDGYFVVHDRDMGDRRELIHTETLVLVDPDRRIRGFYNGTMRRDIELLLLDVERLKQEYGTSS